MHLDPKIGWPPPDPDRMPRIKRTFESSEAFIHNTSAVNDIEAFRQRQAQDRLRQANTENDLQRRVPFSKRFNADLELTEEDADEFDDEGEEAWRNPEGDRLGDFGVDEDAEFYDETTVDDDVPLAEILRRGHAVR